MPVAPPGRPRPLFGRPVDPETGSGTIWVLTLSMLIWFSAFAVVTVAGVRVDRHRAATAADLAALAGARQAVHEGADSCAAARETAEANGARLVECEVSGLTVDTEVRVSARSWPGEVAARARAGPSGEPHDRAADRS